MEAPNADDAEVLWLEVPARPGPLRVLNPAKERDDVEAALDELFGEDDDRGAGIADGVLVVVGLGLVAAALIFDLGGLAVAAGVIAAVLGVAIPLRSLARRRRAQGIARRAAAAAQHGALLRGTDAPVRALVEAYEGLLAVGANQPEALDVGHAAVREVASLLDGRPVATQDQAAYVGERTTALQTLAAAVADRAVSRGPGVGELSVDALVRARRELDAELGSTVDRAAELARRLQARGRDDERG